MVATQPQPELEPELDVYLKDFCTTVKEFEKYVSVYQENMNKDSFESEENIYSYLRGVEGKLTSICDNYPGTELIEAKLPWHQKLFRKMQLNFFEALIQLAHQDKSIVTDLYEVVNFSELKLFTYGPIMYLMSKILGYADQPICQKISAIFCLICEGKTTAVSGDLNLYLWPTESLNNK